MVVVAPPLLEEANRTRAFTVAILRALAGRGIGGVLPDLPGQGESLLPTEAMTLADLRSGFAAVPGTHVLAIRSGVLVADARPCWSLAPQTGPELVREWGKMAPLDGEQVAVAGNRLSRRLLNDLGASDRSDLRRGGRERVVRLTSDPRPADRQVDGAPLWRRSEPGNDPALAQRLTADIADWIAACDR